MEGLKHDIFKMHVSCADLYAMCLIIYLKKAYFCFDREPIILVQGNRHHAIRLADDENHIFYQFNSREDCEQGGKNTIL